MERKLTIAILCGGQSAEHEISILSARNIIAALDEKKFTVVVIYLSQSGRWFWIDPTQETFEPQQEKPLVLIPGNPCQAFALEQDPTQRISVDCVIPMLHGTQGEDGSVQGLLDVLNVPYVASGVLGSTLCMNKHIAKHLLRVAGLPVVDWVYIDNENVKSLNYEIISRQLGNVFFIKPSALGSSIGISKVRNEKEYQVAIQEAFQYDTKVLAERFIKGREIECSVLGNDDPVSSMPGELITSHEFYTYEAKYLDPDSLKIITPADLPELLIERLKTLALAAFKALQCSGMARVDFFVTDEQEVFINELNTVPGFTEMSMYPKNWVASGLSFSRLIEELIQLALGRHEQLSRLSHHYLGKMVTTPLVGEG